MTRVLRFSPPNDAWSVSIRDKWAVLWAPTQEPGTRLAVQSEPITKDLAILIHHGPAHAKTPR